MLERFLLNDNNDFDLSYINRDSNPKTKITNIEEDSKVLNDVNLTVRNFVKDVGDDGEGSAMAHNRQFRFLW